MIRRRFLSCGLLLAFAGCSPLGSESSINDDHRPGLNVPTVTPDATGLTASLSYDFTGGSLPSGITYTRGGAATRHKANGQLELLPFNTPRFEYDPTALTMNGFLVEESRANLMKFNQEFNQSWWTKSRSSVTSNATAAPDGTTTADKLVEDNTAAQTHYIQSTAITKAASSITYTFSIYLKADTRSRVIISLLNTAFTNGAQTTCDLTGAGSVSGTATFGAGYTVAGAKITQLPNSWYRCSITASTDTTAAVRAQVALHNGTSNFYNGDNSSGLYLWGAQVEQAADVSSYIPATNSQLYSDQLENAAWNLVNLDPMNGTNTNSVLAPDGTMTAEFLTEAIVNSGHSIEQTTAQAADQVVTFSFYARKGLRNLIRVFLIDGAASGNNVAVTFDLNSPGSFSGLNVNGNGSQQAASITDAGGGWYRCTLTGKPNTSGTSIRTKINFQNTGGLNSYLGEAGYGGYFWGFQLEEGTVATPYVNVTSSATRNADSAVVSTLGSWFNASAGAILTETKLNSTPVTGNSHRIAAFTDGTTNNVIAQFLTSTNIGMRSVVGGVQQTDATRAYAPLGTFRVGSSYSNNDLQLAVAGNLGTASTAASIPTVSRLVLGSDGTNYLNGYLRSFKYYPVRATDAALSAGSQ